MLAMIRHIDMDACICTCTLYMHTPSYQYAYSPTFMLGWANHFAISTIVKEAPQILYFEI